VKPPTRKQKGDLAELKVAGDLRRRGYDISIPFGEESSYDLVVDRDGRLERVQVKYAERGDRSVIEVRCYSMTIVNGKVRSRTPYTQDSIDWLAVYDATTDRCFYIPACELGDGRSNFTLRFTPTENSQRAGVRFADRYADLVSNDLRLET
jgi:PD-(D/E)XK endonuclease